MLLGPQVASGVGALPLGGYGTAWWERFGGTEVQLPSTCLALRLQPSGSDLRRDSSAERG